MLQSFPSVRLVALDLDGTLLSRNNEVTPATREAIARAVAHGVAVVPATGRPLASLPPVVAKLPGIRYAITSNGAAVWDLGDDPMGAVYSRYSNAAQRHTNVFDPVAQCDRDSVLEGLGMNGNRSHEFTT